MENEKKFNNEGNFSNKDKENTESIKKYPDSEVELAAELLFLMSDIIENFEKQFVVTNERGEIDEKKENLKEEMKQSFIKIAKEVSRLYKTPDKKEWWPSGEKDWKGGLDFLRELSKETKEIADENTKEYQNEELNLPGDERKKIFKEKLNKIFVNLIESESGNISFSFVSLLEKDFNNTIDRQDIKEEKSLWKVLNGLTEMNKEQLKKMDALFKEINEDEELENMF